MMIGGREVSRSLTIPTWVEHFPALKAITDPTWLAVANTARTIKIPAHTYIFHDGEPCKQYLLVFAGSVNVQKVTEDGHEITLYHIQPGHSCELTTACLLGDSCYHAEAITTTAVEAVTIEKQAFMRALNDSTDFRNFIFSAIDSGMNELATLVEEVAFGPMEQRIAQHLLDSSLLSNLIKTTHYDLAVELGTAREVVSRLLKKFERQGWVKLHRGKVEIIEKSRLSMMLKHHVP